MKAKVRPRVSLASVIQQTEAIPALSKVYAQVSKLVTRPKTNAEELARVIQTDQALTVRLLRLSNAAEQARLSPVSTVKQAIVVLGFRAVRAAALSSSVMGSMRRYTSTAVDGLWQRSYAMATASRLLATRLGMTEPEEAFVLGLVQNMGQIILQVKAPKAYLAVYEQLRDPKVTLIDAENRVLGVSHQEVGYLLARRWRLPELITQVVFRHHDPENAGKFKHAAALVYLSDLIAHALGIGSDGDDHLRPMKLEAATLKRFGLNNEDFENIMTETYLAQEGFRDFYNLGG